MILTKPPSLAWFQARLWPALDGADQYRRDVGRPGLRLFVLCLDLAVCVFDVLVDVIVLYACFVILQMLYFIWYAFFF